MGIEDSIATREATSLLDAVQKQDWAKTNQLLETQGNFGPSQPGLDLAFSLAVYHKQWQIVESLVSKGLDPNGRSLDGQPAISLAALSDAWNTVKFLSQKGANLEVRNADGRTVLLIAASGQNWEMVDWLASAGGNIRAVASSVMFPRITALSFAASYRDWKHIRPLLEAGVDCNSLALNQDPVLVFAAAAGQWYTVRLLIEKGANVNAKDRHERRAMSYALPCKFSTKASPAKAHAASKIVDLLVKKGAKFGTRELEFCPKGTLVEDFLRDEMPSTLLADDLKAFYPVRSGVGH